MRAAKFISTCFATGAIAFGAGHIIENGESTAALIGSSLSSPGMARASVLPDGPSMPRPPLETLLATPLPTTRGWVQTQPDSLDLSPLDRSAFDQVTDAGCDADFQAEPINDGMIRVTLVSPCSFNDAVTLRHEGLSFTEVTTESGRMTVEFPALAEDALVEAVLPTGDKFSAELTVPDADNFHRVALIWRGETGLQIHAQEFGANLGSSGHVWAGSPGRSDLGINSKGGYILPLGDRSIANGTRAEVYTFPIGASQNSGSVEISVRTLVQNTNCGHVFAAQAVQPDALGGVQVDDITMRIPDCDSIGQHLVLKEIIGDLQVASR